VYKYTYLLISTTSSPTKTTDHHCWIVENGTQLILSPGKHRNSLSLYPPKIRNSAHLKDRPTSCWEPRSDGTLHWQSDRPVTEENCTGHAWGDLRWSFGLTQEIFRVVLDLVFRGVGYIFFSSAASFVISYSETNFFYCAMHFSAKRGITIACHPSVCLSVCEVDGLRSHRLEISETNYTDN